MQYSRSPQSYSVEELAIENDVLWIRIRARGAEWSWFTPEEALAIARMWIDRYSPPEEEQNP